MPNQAKEKIAKFVGKLWDVLEEEKMPDTFQWDSDGKEVEINLQKCDLDKLKQELSIQVSSLERLMRRYGFKKKEKTSQGGKMVYSNPLFQRSQPELRSHIKMENHKQKNENINATPVNANTPQEERKSDQSLAGQDPRKQIPSIQDDRKISDLHVKIEEEKSDLQKGNSDPKTIEENYKEIVSKPIIERHPLVNIYDALKQQNEALKQQNDALKQQKDKLQEAFNNMNLLIASLVSQNNLSQLIRLQQKLISEQHEKYEKLLSAGNSRVS